MNELLETYHFLTNRLAADPLLSLAQTVVWLDPLWLESEEDEDTPPDEDGTLALALRITRRVFPEVYTQAVEELRRGATYADLDRLICAAFAQQGIPLESLEWIGFGVPVPAYGVVLEDPDSYTTHPDIIPVLDVLAFCGRRIVIMSKCRRPPISSDKPSVSTYATIPKWTNK